MHNCLFWQLRETFFCITHWDLGRLLHDKPNGWTAELALQRRWFGWDLGRSRHFWDRTVPWYQNNRGIYLLPDLVSPALDPNSVDYYACFQRKPSIDGSLEAAWVPGSRQPPAQALFATRCSRIFGFTVLICNLP